MNNRNGGEGKRSRKEKGGVHLLNWKGKRNRGLGLVL
jgi:hypothetical protein